MSVEKGVLQEARKGQAFQPIQPKTTQIDLHAQFHHFSAFVLTIVRLWRYSRLSKLYAQGQLATPFLATHLASPYSDNKLSPSDVRKVVSLAVQDDPQKGIRDTRRSI